MSDIEIFCRVLAGWQVYLAGLRGGPELAKREREIQTQLLEAMFGGKGFLR